MAKKAYDTWLNSLPDDQKVFAQTLMALLMAMLDDRFNSLADDVARNERRLKTNSERVAELHIRLDQYETQQWHMAQEAIENFAKQQLPKHQREKLIETLHTVARDVEALKAKQAGDGSKQ